MCACVRACVCVLIFLWDNVCVRVRVCARVLSMVVTLCVPMSVSLCVVSPRAYLYLCVRVCVVVYVCGHARHKHGCVASLSL